jgi:myosin heavy subunit
MAKHMCTDHEELYKNLLKPQMKVGNELVSKVSNKNRANIFMQTLLVMADVENTLYRLQIKTYQL